MKTFLIIVAMIGLYVLIGYVNHSHARQVDYYKVAMRRPD